MEITCCTHTKTLMGILQEVLLVAGKITHINTLRNNMLFFTCISIAIRNTFPPLHVHRKC